MVNKFRLGDVLGFLDSIWAECAIPPLISVALQNAHEVVVNESFYQKAAQAGYRERASEAVGWRFRSSRPAMERSVVLEAERCLLARLLLGL